MPDGFFTLEQARHLSTEEYFHYATAGCIKVLDPRRLESILERAQKIYREEYERLERDYDYLKQELEILRDKLGELGESY